MGPHAWGGRPGSSSPAPRYLVVDPPPTQPVAAQLAVGSCNPTVLSHLATTCRAAGMELNPTCLSYHPGPPGPRAYPTRGTSSRRPPPHQHCAIYHRYFRLPASSSSASVGEMTSSRKTFEMFFFFFFLLLLPLCHPLPFSPPRCVSSPASARVENQRSIPPTYLRGHTGASSPRGPCVCSVSTDRRVSFSIARTLQDAVIVTDADGGVLVPTYTCTMAHTLLPLPPPPTASLTHSHSHIPHTTHHTHTTQPPNTNNQFGIRRRTPSEWPGASWTAMYGSRHGPPSHEQWTRQADRYCQAQTGWSTRTGTVQIAVNTCQALAPGWAGLGGRLNQC